LLLSSDRQQPSFYFCRNELRRQRQLIEILATPAGIEPATNSLEVVGKTNNFNVHSDKTGLPATLSDMTKFQFVGMTRQHVTTDSRSGTTQLITVTTIQRPQGT
jgi:hypothetical protein